MTPDEIKKIREKLGLTQERFAKLINITNSTVNRWENGHSKPSPLAVDKIISLTTAMENVKK